MSEAAIQRMLDKMQGEVNNDIGKKKEAKTNIKKDIGKLREDVQANKNQIKSVMDRVEELEKQLGEKLMPKWPSCHIDLRKQKSSRHFK